MNLDLTQQMPQHGHFAAVNGMQMYYEVHGQGDLLVLLHGFGSTSLTWQPFVDEFAKHFKVIVPDLRGHGRSLDPNNHFTFAQAALDVFVLLEQLGIERFKAIGSSGGGLVLEAMATLQPARLGAIILLSCGYYFTEQSRAASLEWADSDDSDLNSLSQEYIEGMSQLRSLINQVPKLIDNFNANPPDLSSIIAKTLIICGDHDEYVHVSTLVEMYSVIPHAYLWIVPNAIHGAMTDDLDRQGAIFVRTALAFLKDEW